MQALVDLIHVLHSLDTHIAFYQSPKICSISNINCALNEAVDVGKAKFLLGTPFKKCKNPETVEQTKHIQSDLLMLNSVLKVSGTKLLLLVLSKR